MPIFFIIGLLNDLIGYQTEQKIDRGSDCPPIAYAKNVYIPRDLLDEDLNRHGVLALGPPEKQPEDPILCSIRSRIKVRKRTDRSVKDNTAFVQEASDRRRFRIAASGVDLEGNIISKEVSFIFNYINFLCRKCS